MSAGTPAHWTEVRFGEVVRQVKESVDPTDGSLDWYVAGEHMGTDDLRIRARGRIGDGYLGPAFHRRFRPGQVLYGSRRTYLRKVAVADFDGVCANTTFVCEAHDERLLPELLPFIMQTEAFHAHSIALSKGSVNPYINWRDIASFSFSLPPRDRQEELVRIFTAAEASLEAELEICQAAMIARRAYVEEALRQHRDLVVRLETAGEWRSGGTPAKKNALFWGGDIPWVSPKDMKSDTLRTTLDTLTTGAVDAGARLAPEGTIFMVVRGMILAHTFPVARAARPMAFNQDVKALVPNGAFDGGYLFRWLQHNAPRCLTLVSDSSHGTKRVPTDALLALQIEQPPVEVQREIAATADSLDELHEATREKRVALAAAKQYLLGELVVPGDAR